MTNEEPTNKNETDPKTAAFLKTNAIRAYRNKYGRSPSHFGKPEEYYRRANTPKSQRKAA